MATQQVSLRLGTDVIAQLDYLQTIAHKSQARLVAELIAAYYHGVTTAAFGRATSPYDRDPELVIGGGTIITVEEQKALKTVLARLAGEAVHD